MDENAQCISAVTGMHKGSLLPNEPHGAVHVLQVTARDCMKGKLVMCGAGNVDQCVDDLCNCCHSARYANQNV